MPIKKNTSSSSFPSFKKIAVGFIVLAIILLIFIVYFSFAKATIVLKVDQEPRTLSLELNVAALATEIEADLNSEFITDEIEISKNFTVENFKEIPAQATGKIRVINNHTQNQALVRTTRFLSPEGILFRLEKTINVPAGGELVVDVYADKEGAESNLDPTQFTIPGLSTALQEKIYGVSDKPMTGGFKKIGILAQSDVDKSQQAFLDNINAEIKEKMASLVGEDKVILEDLISKKVLSQKVSEKIGEEVDSFTITNKLSVTLIIVDEEKLIEKAKEIYREKLIEEIQITNWDLESFKYLIKEINLENKTAILNVSLTAEVQGSFDVENFDKTEIAGFDKKGVEYYFSQFPSIQEVEVKFSPFWVRSVPALADRIKIEIE